MYITYFIAYIAGSSHRLHALETLNIANVVLEIRSRTDAQTDRHAHGNTLTNTSYYTMCTGET